MAKNSIEIKLTSDSKRQPTVIKRDAHGRRVHESKGQPSTEAQKPVQAVTPSAPVQSTASATSQNHGAHFIPGWDKGDEIVRPLEKKKARSLIKEEKQVEQEEDDQTPAADPPDDTRRKVKKEVTERVKKGVGKRVSKKISRLLPRDLDEDVTGEMGRKDTGRTARGEPEFHTADPDKPGQQWRSVVKDGRIAYRQPVIQDSGPKPRPVGGRGRRGKGVVSAARRAATATARGAGRAMDAMDQGRGGTGPHAIRTTAGRGVGGGGGGTPKALAGSGGGAGGGAIASKAKQLAGFARGISKTGVAFAAVGIAVESAIKAFVKLDSFLVKASDDIQAFSPEIIGEKVERSVMLLEKKIERAGAVGEDMAKYEAARTKVMESLETMKTALIKFVLPYMITIMEWIAKIAEFLASIRTNIKILLLIVEIKLTEILETLSFGLLVDEEYQKGLKEQLRLLRKGLEKKLKVVDWDHMDRVLSLLTGSAGAIPGQTPAGPGGPPVTIASGL